MITILKNLCLCLNFHIGNAFLFEQCTLRNFSVKIPKFQSICIQIGFFKEKGWKDLSILLLSTLKPFSQSFQKNIHFKFHFHKFTSVNFSPVGSNLFLKKWSAEKENGSKCPELFSILFELSLLLSPNIILTLFLIKLHKIACFRFLQLNTTMIDNWLKKLDQSWSYLNHESIWKIFTTRNSRKLL
jgi:hypothetical protein